MDKIKFFRRRQFVLGSEHLSLEGWKRIRIDETHFLTFHPDLPVYQARDKDTSIALLGYMIDPEHPNLDEPEIMKKMLSLRGVNEVQTQLLRMNGRFILIVNLKGAIFLFHDAGGLRQIVYCKDKNGNIWSASQAETLGEKLGFSLDQEVIDYRKSMVFRDAKHEFWLTNTRTPYKEVFQLLPNHYLDVQQGKAIRFWPVKNSIRALSLNKAILLTEPMLRNSIEAACRKFNLRMGISAGIDSRRTLAAAKHVKDKLLCFTIEHKQSGRESVDVMVPRKLLKKLAIRHEIIMQKYMIPDFRQLYESSASFARENKGDIAYTLFEAYGSEVTILNSNTAEISQCNYWLPKSRINGEGLAIITGLYHILAIKEFDKWLSEARKSCEESGINIMTLFHWEQRVGRWAAASFGEYDIVHESFTPYNNRLLITCLLGINERYRRNRKWTVSIKQIRKTWLEVLSEPVNPATGIKEKLVMFLRRKILHKTLSPWIPIYEYLTFLIRKRRGKQYTVTNNDHM